MKKFINNKHLLNLKPITTITTREIQTHTYLKIDFVS